MNNQVETLIEVSLSQDDDFLKIKETLTRIGIASPRDKKMYQSCHILHKQGKYYITHFKELFALDGKKTDFSDEDRARRNTIAKLLQDWNLLKIVSDMNNQQYAPINHIKIISHKEKANWELIPKYNIGNKGVSYKY
jgi:hypothetical protein